MVVRPLRTLSCCWWCAHRAGQCTLTCLWDTACSRIKVASATAEGCFVKWPKSESVGALAHLDIVVGLRMLLSYHHSLFYSLFYSRCINKFRSHFGSNTIRASFFFVATLPPAVIQNSYSHPLALFHSTCPVSLHLPLLPLPLALAPTALAPCPYCPCPAAPCPYNDLIQPKPYLPSIHPPNNEPFIY